MVWTSAILLAGPVLLLLLALRNRDAREPASLRLLLVIGAIAVGVPLSYAVFWRSDAARVSIELKAVAFRSGGSTLRKVVSERRPNSGRIVIGESIARNALPRRTFGTFVFTPRAAGSEAKGSLRIELPAAPLRAGLVSVESAGLLGAERLQDGDALCIAGSCWQYAAGDQSFTLGSYVERIPSRQAELPGLGWTFNLPFARPAPATQRTWSVEFLARRAGTIPAGRRVQSFLSFGRQDRSPRLMALDDDVFVRRGGVRVAPAMSAPVADGERVAFYSLPGGDSQKFAAPPIAERRSLVHRAGGRSFALDLDTPEMHSLTVDELSALVLPQGGKAQKKRVALSMGEAQLVDKSLYFSGLSESVAVEANALYEVSQSFPGDFQSLVRLISARGAQDSPLGGIQWIGSTDLAAVRFDVLRPPLVLLVAGVALMLLNAVAAWLARLTTTQGLMLGALQLLLGIRLLIGYRVWTMPPHNLEAAQLAVIAWMALPWIFVVASMPLLRMASWKSLGSAPALCGLILSMVVSVRVSEGRTRFVWVVFHLLALGVAVLRSEEVRSRLARDWKRLRGSAARGWAGLMATRPVTALRDALASGTMAVRLVCGVVAMAVIWILVRDAVGPVALVVAGTLALVAGFFARSIARWSGRFFDADMTPIIVAAVALTVFRLLLLFFGFKESANLGMRMSLSVLHIPAGIVLEGLFLFRLWRRLRARGAMQPPDFAAAAAILFFVWALPAALTSDVGLALLNVPLFGLLLLAVTRHAQASRGLVRLLVAAVVIFIAGAPLLRVALPWVRSEEFLLSAASDSNYARFMHFAAPEKLQEQATKRGESLAITSAILQSYIRSGPFGYGYGHSEVINYLGDTALRDFAPAVFVAAEWGLVGTVTLLLLYLLFSVIAIPWLPWSEYGVVDHPGPAIAAVAAGTITVSSIYMILANHELLLLTGKNAYLLGLDSAGDIIEVIVLLFLIAYGSSIVRDDAGAVMRGSA